jgi:hypothetical protein
MCGTYFIVPLAVSGDPDRVLDLILDTGASHTIVDPDSLERVSGQRVEPGRHARFTRLTAGPVTISGLRARSRELDHIGHALGRPVDGILGFPAFGDALLVLDYPARQVRVAEGRLPRPDGREILPLARREKKRPWLALEIAGRSRDILIDSGSGSGLVLQPSRRYDWLVKPLPVRASMRINRLERREVGRMAGTLSLGPHAVEQPIVEMTYGTELMGAEVLRQFEMTFDSRRRRVRLRRTGGVGPIRSEPLRGTGLLFHPRQQGLEVIDILDGSPAAASGLRVGDMVVAIDGRPVAKRDCGRFGLKPADEQQKVSLAVRRDDSDMEVSIDIVDLVP